MVSFRKATINNHEVPIGLDGAFAPCHTHRHMPIDDVPVLAFNAKGIKNTFTHLCIIAQQIVVTFLLVVGALIAQEITLKGSHAIFVKER